MGHPSRAKSRMTMEGAGLHREPQDNHNVTTFEKLLIFLSLKKVNCQVIL